MSPALHRAAPRMFSALSALAFLSLLSCGREVTGPESRRMAMLALAPEFSGPMSAIDGAGDAVPFERVRVVLRGDDGSIVKDTVVDFPSDAESISLSLTIPIPQDAPSEGLPLSVAMAYVNAAGDTVFRGGPNPLIARPIGTPGSTEPVTIPVTYDGPGKDAARVAITPKSGNAVAGQTTAFAASAFDNADQLIANTPFIFSSLDTTRALVDPVTGVATWRAVRGPASVIAQLPNGLRADTATFTIALPAAKLVLGSGDAQTGAVNAPLADTIVLRTLASDDVPVEGVVVTFAVATGGGALSVSTDTSDADGNVRTVWTLGGTLGAQTITATSAGLTGSPLTIGATATAATPVRLEIQAQPSTGVAGAALAPALTVIARDAFGNAVPTFTDSVIVSVLGTNPPPLGGTQRREPVTGTTTFDDLSLTTAGEFELVVTSGSLAPDTSAAFTIAPSAVRQLLLVSGDADTAAVTQAFGAPLRVRVVDEFGNAVAAAVTTWVVQSGGATLAADSVLSDVDGFAENTATHSGTLVALGTIRASVVGGTAPRDFVYTTTAGAATQLVVTTQPSATLTAGAAFTVAVEARDAFGNRDLTFADSAVIGLLNGGTGATLNGATRRAMVAGLVEFTGLSLDTTGTFDFFISAPGLPTAVTDPTQVTAGAPAILARATVSNDGQIGAAGDTLAPFRVRVTDAFGNPVSGVTVTWTPTSGGTFVDPTSVTDANGEAESRLIAPGVTGPTSAIAEVSGLSGSPLGFSASLTSASASALFIIVAPTPSTPAGIALTGFVVRAQDRFGHPTSFSDTVRVAIADGPVGGQIIAGDTAVLADSSATFFGITFDVSGTYTLEFRAAGLDSARYVPITVVAGAATSVTALSGDGQSGAVTTTLANPLVAEVRDQFGNPVIGVDVQWAVTAGDATLSVGLVATDSAGRATADVLLGSAVSTVTVTATVDGLPAVTFTVSSVAGEAVLPVELTVPTSGTAGAALPAFSYAVVDQFDNIATGYTGTATVSLQAFGGSQPPVILSGDTAAVLNGVATWSALTVSTAGQYQLVADFGGTIGTITSGVITIDAGAPALLVNVAGDGQSVGVTQTFANPLRARVTDAWGNGVANVTVNFNVINGLAALATSVAPTDLDGFADATVIADTLAGPVLFGAFAAGLTPDSVLYALTVLPDAPSSIDSVVGGNQVIGVGTTSDTVRVRLVDQFRNPVVGARVFWSTSGVLTSASDSSLTDSLGFAATVATAGVTPGEYAILASYPESEVSVAIPVTVEAGAAVALQVITEPSGGSAGTPLSSLAVEVTDAFGNRVTASTATISVTVDSALTTGALGGTLSVAAVAGLATFSDLLLTQAGPYALVVSAAGLGADTTAAFDLLAGEPTSVTALSGDGQSGIVGTALATPLAMTVRDAFGNPVPSTATFWSVTPPATAALDTTDVQTDSLGVARVGLTFGSAATALTVTGSAGDAGSVVFSLTAVNGPATALQTGFEPAQPSAGAVLGVAEVDARDALGNPALDFVGDVTVVIDSGPSGATLGGTTTVTAIAGRATFSDLALDIAGAYRLRFEALGLASTLSSPFVLGAGAASVISIVSGDAQTGTVDTPLADSLVVRVTDAFGNPVAGVGLTWTPSAGLVLGTPPTETDVAGQMALVATLGTTAGPYTASAAITALPDSSVTFALTAEAGAPVTLVVISAPDTVQAATASTAFVLELRDTFGNRVTAFTDSVSVVISDGPASGITAGDTAVAAVAGVATFANLQFGAAGSYFLEFTGGGVEPLFVNLEVIPGTPAVLQLVSGNGQLAFATLPLDTAFTVRVVDAAANAVAGESVTWTVLPGSGGGLVDGLASTSVTTDASGLASVSFTSGTTLGTQSVRAAIAVDSVEFAVTVSELIGNSVWTGNVDTDWANTGNWINGQVPLAGDSVHLVGGRPRYPVLLGDVAMTKLWVDDGVTGFDVANHNVLVSGNIRAPLAPAFSITTGSIRGVGTGAHTVRGTLPMLQIESGTYSSDAGVGEAFTIAGALLVQGSGLLALDASDSVVVGGTFTTAGGGQLEQATGSTLQVAGDVEFGGGVSDLAGGRLFVGGNFTTTGLEQAAFRAATTHETHFVGGVQTVTLAFPEVSYGAACASSCFGRLVAEATAGSDTLRFLSDVKARDRFVIENGGVFAATHTLVAGPTSTLRGDSTVIGVLGFIDTYPDLGAIQVIDSVVAGGSGAFPSNLTRPTTIVGNFTVDGPVVHGNALAVSGTGRLLMNEVTDTLTVSGSATFNGGMQAGDLTNGVLRVSGLFDAGPGRFIAEAAHVTELFGDTTSQFGMSGAGGDAGQNRFASLLLNKGSGAAVFTSTPVFVDGQLRTVGADQSILGAGAANPLTIRGANIQALRLNWQPLILTDGAAVDALQGLQFENFQTVGLAQLRIERSGGGVTVQSPVFDTVASVGAPLYLVADDQADDGDTLTVTVSNPAPALNGGLVQLLNGARLLGWTDFSAIEWTGAFDNSWTNGENWLQGRPPTAEDSVVVFGGDTPDPVITSDVSIRALNYQGLTPLDLNAELTIRDALFAGFGSPAVACTADGRIRLVGLDSSRIGGTVSCPVFMTAGITRTDGSFVADSIIIDGTGELHLRDGDVLEVNGDLRTGDAGTLRMEGTSETQLIVRGNARFSSAPTAGALTGGALVIFGNFTQEGAPTAFRPGPDMRVVLSGVDNRTVLFANPDPDFGSYFGDLSVALNQAPTVTLASDVFVEGRLIGSFNSGGTLVGNTTRTLRSRGASIGLEGGLQFQDVQWDIIAGDTLDATLRNVSFASFAASGVPQLRILRDSGVVTLSNFTFDSAAAAPLYLRLEDSAPTDSFPLQVTMSAPTPAFHAGAIDTLGGAQLLGWEPEPSFVWTGAATPDGSWTNPANWESGVVPSATSIVTIPSATTQLPVLTSGPVTIRGLINESDTIGVFLGSGVNLIVTDELRTSTAPSGLGVTCQDNSALLVIGGNATTLSGRVAGCDVLAASGTASVDSAFIIQQSLALTGAHALDINGGVLRVDGDLTLGGTAGVVMDAAADSVVVLGTAVFAGGPSVLTDGQLIVESGFTSSGTGTFVATGAHRTHLGGNGLLDFYTITDDDGDLRFGRLDVAGGAFVAERTFTADSLFIGDVTSLAQSAIGQRLGVVGDVVFGIESSLDVRHLSLGGRLDQDGSLSVDTLVLNGTAQRLAKYTTTGTEIAYPRIEVTGDVTTQVPTGETMAIFGDVLVRDGGSLRFVSAGDTTTILINGSLTTRDNGVIAMDSGGTVVTVDGDAVFDGGDTEGLLRAGTLQISGSFTQLSTTSPRAFAATETHRVVFVGGLDSSRVSLATSSPTTSRFNDLRFEKAQGQVVQFFDDSVFTRTLTADFGFISVDGGSLIVLDSAVFSESISVVHGQAGILDIRGAALGACLTSSVNVFGFKGNFAPSSCHTQTLDFATQESITAENLNGLWVVSPSEVLAVGDNGTVLESDQTLGAGTTWSPLASNTAEHLYAVTAVFNGTNYDYYAAGANGTVLQRLGTSGQWQVIQQSPGGSAFRAIHAQSATSIYFVGDGGLVRFFDGTEWTQPNLGGTTEDLFTIGESGDSLYIAGSNGALFRSVAGGEWVPQTSNTTKALFGFTPTSPTERFLVGSGGHLTRLEDSTTTFAVSPGPVPEDLYAIGAFLEFGTVVGANGRVLERQGSSWTRLQAPTAATLRAVKVFQDGASVYALIVGDGGLVYLVFLGFGPQG